MICLDSETAEDEDGYYPGLVNISGTYCFMNSTIQALASLSYLHPHIAAIQRKAEALDVPTPVVDALKDLLNGACCRASQTSTLVSYVSA